MTGWIRTLSLVPRDLPALDQFDEAVVVAGAGDRYAAGFVREALHQCRVASRPVGVVEVAGVGRFDREVGRVSLRSGVSPDATEPTCGTWKGPAPSRRSGCARWESGSRPARD